MTSAYLRAYENENITYKPSNKSSIITTLGLYLPLIIWVIVTIFPFWYMLVLSTRPMTEIFSYPPPLLFKADMIQEFVNNYNNLLKQIPFWRNLWNSFYIASMTTILSSFFVSLGGFGFAIYKFRGKSFLFAFMLFTMMIPQVASIIPYFIMMKAFGWLNTAKALYIPAIANAMGIFMMTQYIKSSIPMEIIDAARMDGCSEFEIFYRIIFPLITPALGSYGIITFLSSWNNYMGALVVLRDIDALTVPIALGTLRGMQSVDFGAIMVATVISVVPLILIFVIFSRLIIKKVTEGALK